MGWRDFQKWQDEHSQSSRRWRDEHSQSSSAAQPAYPAPRSWEQTRARSFLKALDDAAYVREDNGNAAEATLLRELINALSSGKLLLKPASKAWHLEQAEREEIVRTKLDRMLELAIGIRAAWIEDHAEARRRLEAHRGDMSEPESQKAVRYLLSNKMTRGKREDYDYCFQSSGSEKLLFAVVRQPSVLRGEGVDQLLDDWVYIKNSTEYKRAVEQSKEILQWRAEIQAELQNLRMRINRCRRDDQDATHLLEELAQKEQIYEKGKKRALELTTSPRSTRNPSARSASATRPLRPRCDQTRDAATEGIPPKPTRVVPVVLNFGHEITEDVDVDWTLDPLNRARELRLRQERNQMIKQDLLLGKPVIYRSQGWSLWPRVHANDRCTFDPVYSADEVREQDIVFCQVQPSDRFFGHLVSVKWYCVRDQEWYFTITNLKGWENGWCAMKHIYGKLIRVER